MRGAAIASCSLLLGAGAGCSKAEQTSLPPLPGPTEWNRPVTPPTDADAAAARSACTYQKDSLPAETEGASHPMGTDIPIDHILVLMMENRSFDHYFEKLPEYGQPDAEVAPAGFSNPDAMGNPVPIFHSTVYCFPDTDHEWNATHLQLDGGKMDGFFKTNDGVPAMNPPGVTKDMLSGKRALGYYDQTDIPFYYWLANEFAIGDHYFAALPGPTFPNRYFMYAATSFGVTGEALPPPGATLITDYLSERQVDWKIYRDRNCPFDSSIAAQPGMGEFVSQVGQYATESRFHTIAEYLADAAQGTLPAFAFVDPALGQCTGDYRNDDDHPSALPQTGEKFVATIVAALAKSPSWPRSALFLTYDEHGGLFDHVVPPKACPPDDIPPDTMPADQPGKFDQYGVRVPFIVVSPFAKKHYVSHQVYDHTSILRFIEARFVMPALTNRDANALAPYDLFDFAGAPHLEPPAVTIPDVSEDKLAACKAIFQQ